MPLAAFKRAFPGSLQERSAATLATPAGLLPRGKISEVVGAASSGRTSLIQTCIANVTSASEYAAYLDVSDSFDPAAAAAGGIALSCLLWIRCQRQVEHAFQATSLLLDGGGFGLIVLDLADCPARHLQMVPLSWWHRLRRAVEATSTLLLVLSAESQARSCAARVICLEKPQTSWRGQRVLSGRTLSLSVTKPPQPERRTLSAQAHW